MSKPDTRFAWRWPDHKRRAAAMLADVAANIGVTPGEVECWCRQPDFAAAVRRYRFT